jgi:hypothetical protein
VDGTSNVRYEWILSYGSLLHINLLGFAGSTNQFLFAPMMVLEGTGCGSSVCFPASDMWTKLGEETCFVC